MFTRPPIITAASVVLALFLAGGAGASTLVPQTALPGGCIPQFAVPMPVFGPAGPIPRVNALGHREITVTMEEIAQSVLPTDTSKYNPQYFDPFSLTYLNCPSGLNIQQTRVWAYGMSDTKTGKQLAPPNWPAVTVQARRFVPTTMTYKNNLPKFGDPITINGTTTSALVQGLVSVDQSIDWADPLGLAALNGCTMFPQDPNNVFTTNPGLNPYCNTPYQGTPPAVAHLHGGESSSYVDGGPLAWFTPDGKKGKDFYSQYNAGPGAAVYRYDNFQEPGTLWFHDHVMGQTRTNVYSGMAAFFFLEDPLTQPRGLPDGPYEIEMAIQDRQFDTNGQLFFPDGSPSGANQCGSGLAGDPCLNGPPPNPSNHPLWVPEFIGDVAIVNGAPWPVLHVEPRRYRLHLLDGSNARMYNLDFGPVPVYAVGADDNYLNRPVKIGKVFIAPGERSDVIVDFSKVKFGTTITVTNDAPVPFPSGLFPVPHPDPVTGALLPADQPQMASIMQFVVDKHPSWPEMSCNPAWGKCGRPFPMARLTDGLGHVASGVKIDRKRQLILKEFEGPGGPLMVLVNNTQFMGTMSPGVDASVFPDGITEVPQEGSVEEWEIINLTMDAHPMHTHLAQFQILNRQVFDIDGTMGSGIAGGYLGAWNAAFGTGPAPLFPGCTAGQFCPGFGPPLPYQIANADGALGGNPAVSPFLVGAAAPPNPEESGWKDTAKAYPGQVLRFLIRFTPTAIPVLRNISFAGHNLYPFDPTQGPGYVWHCHIIDHEDQDMMRPYRVSK
ncbi:MAG TPA: multicopper oxidase domain-containing protein [Desulfuromonadaceae bacterium]